MAVGLTAIFLTLGFVGWELQRNLGSIDQLVDRLIEVEVPTKTTAYEMEINVLGSGLGVWNYIGTGAAVHRERVEKDQADFRDFRAEYGRLAASPAERELGERLDALYGPYAELCDTLMDEHDEYLALLRRAVDTVDQIDRIVDEQLQAGLELEREEHLPKLMSWTALEADVAEIGAAIGAYAAAPWPRHRAIALEAAGEAREAVVVLRELALTPEERIHVERIWSLLDGAAAEIERGVALRQTLLDHEASFIALRDELDDLLDEGIQVLAKRGLSTEQPRVTSLLGRLYVLSRTLIAVGAGISAGAIGLFAYLSIQLRAANQGLRKEMARLVESEGARERLYAELVSVEEKERGRLARELHDQMGQDLAVLKLELADLARTLGSTLSAGPASAQIAKLQALTADLVEQVHAIAWDLRPATIDELGVHGAFGHYLEEWQRRSGVSVDLESGLEGQRLPPPLEIALYRVLQEALTNVVKHAQASNVSVTLQRHGDEVVMVVEDDGHGFEPDAIRPGGSTRGRLGLIGMRERAVLAGGELHMESAPGTGTTLVVRIPVAGPR